MQRILVTGGPGCGKTTLAAAMTPVALHTDDLIPMGWSEASQHVADVWLEQPGPWLIEGVAIPRALRKWRRAHPGRLPPCERIIWLTQPRKLLDVGQRRMMTAHDKILIELLETWHGLSPLLETP